MPPLTPVVKQLLIINAVVFFGILLLQNFSPELGYNLDRLLALYYPTSEYFRPFQIVTHFFMHGNVPHIALNMFGLVMFGPLLEHRYGGRRFLILYLLAAMTSVALHFGYTWFQLSQLEDAMAAFRANPGIEQLNDFFGHVRTEGISMFGEPLPRLLEDYGNNYALGRDVELTTSNSLVMMEAYQGMMVDTPMVGASGALYGVVVAFAMIYPMVPLRLLFIPFSIQARYFIPIMLAIDLFLGIMNYSWDPIAHFAHLGGALGGGLLAYYWRKKDPPAGAQRWN